MRHWNHASFEHARIGEDLGSVIDEIVGLYIELEQAKVAERATLRRKLAAAGFRLNRLAARQRTA